MCRQLAVQWPEVELDRLAHVGLAVVGRVTFADAAGK
jgi:hypothetical protein